ncbi:MAG: MoxR family ATPase [Ruminococcaceae bacterium]|nr:MoxR family ATPase [Oscillospiraceae bacterium]
MSNNAFLSYQKIKNNVSKVIVGKDEVIDLMTVALFTEGHMLICDVPGTGKTMLTKAFAASVGGNAARIQFTPDLLPGDITGVRYFNMKTAEFEFVPGPCFTNILLADEINRATPKTQSGLLECMEERQATIDGTTYPLPHPFMVIATENPIENMGVFPLPEAQLDRFLFKTSMNYPTAEENTEILLRFASERPAIRIEPVITADEIPALVSEVASVYVHPDLINYITRIVEATRTWEGVALGVSPRGAIALMKAAKGFATLSNRDYVWPDDIKKAAVPCLAHRLILKSSHRVKKDYDAKIIEDILHTVSVPTESDIFYSKR